MRPSDCAIAGSGESVTDFNAGRVCEACRSYGADTHEDDRCRRCQHVFSARELRAWREEFGICADEAPHMQDTPSLCEDCAETVEAEARGAR